MMNRSLALLGTGLLVSLVMACGDDGASNGNCGDGHVTGSEQCDDGNSVSGDGCSATCKNEGSCGNGVVEVATETCDDGNTTSGDGCSATCATESGTCGNNQVEGTEQCDDGNSISGDGCSATCMTEMAVGGTCTMPSNIMLTAMGTALVGNVTGDTTNATNGVAEASCDGGPAGAGKDQMWKFTLTDTRDVFIELDPDAAFDGGIRLMTTACNTTTEIKDQIGDDGCSDSGYEGDPEYLGYVNLPAGTYFVSVDGYESTSAGTYELHVTASLPTCGDGTLGDIEFCDDGNTTNGDGCTHCTVDTNYTCDTTSEPSVCKMKGCGDGIIQTAAPFNEQCDDNNMAGSDGCSATCQVEAGSICQGTPSVCKPKGCGNGFIEADLNEECDDGNTSSNDRCAATTCLLEQDYTEPAETCTTTGCSNDAIPQVLTPGNHIIRGSFQAKDVDLYTFTLATASRVEIETYSTINGSGTDYDGVGNALFDCLTLSDDPEIAIFPSTATVTDDNMALFIDDDDGDKYCSYLGPNDDDGDATQLAMLAAGTYTIRLKPSIFASSTLPATRYMLDLKIGTTTTAAVPPAAGDIKINEFLAADGGSTNGGVDTNCDGALGSSDDEFIELVNVSTTKTLDLTGVTYSDSTGVKFTFAAQAHGSLTLAPGKAVVLWGGGTPNCSGVTNYFTNGTAHTLSLNDTGDTISIKTGGASPVTIATTTYTSALAPIGPTPPRQSANLNPDVSGTSYVLHTAVTGHVGNFSPGKKADGTAF